MKSEFPYVFVFQKLFIKLSRLTKYLQYTCIIYESTDNEYERLIYRASIQVILTVAVIVVAFVLFHRFFFVVLFSLCLGSVSASTY